jgi:hypothetical protein
MEGFTAADTAIAALLRVRVEDGTIERRWDLPVEALGHTAGGANSQWEKYDAAGRRIAGAKLAPTVVLRVPLERK